MRSEADVDASTLSLPRRSWPSLALRRPFGLCAAPACYKPGVRGYPTKPSAGATVNRRGRASFFATVGAKTVRAALVAAERAGLDVPRLAADVGIELARLADPDARVPHDSWVALFRHLEQRTGDPGIGLHLVGALPFGHFDAVDYLVASSATAEEGLARLVRAFPIVSTAAEHTVRRVGAELRVTRASRPGVATTRAGTELAIGGMVRRLAELSGGAFVPERIELAHPPSVSPETYARVLLCPVLSEREAHVVVYRASSGAVPMRDAAPTLSLALDAHVEVLLARLGEGPPGTAEAVRRAVARDLSAGPPSLACVAKALAMAPRTLQRRLEAEGTDYRSVVDTTREDAARAYLADGRYAVGEVAYLVGFSDPSAFQKAFTRWTGKSPGAYRAALTASAPRDARAPRRSPTAR